MTRALICRGDCTDPRRNLAVESRLLAAAESGVITLFLWQNDRSVIIGRNQNAWRECRVAEADAAGVPIVRRLSGGGAVYHDLGNLNYTFISKDLDARADMEIVASALGYLGIDASISGRNDISSRGRKLSGTASYRSRTGELHHGTLLVSCDIDEMTRLLRPSCEKLASKGVASVRARVNNIANLAPGTTVDDVKAALRRAFESAYGPAEKTDPPSLDDDDPMLARFSSPDWNLGVKVPFTFSCCSRFEWGGVELQFDCRSDIVRSVKLWTDAMDHRTSAAIEQLLIGANFSRHELAALVRSADCDENVREDIAALIEKQDL